MAGSSGDLLGFGRAFFCFREGLARLLFLDYSYDVIELKQTETFAKWEGRLRDKRAKTMIAARLARLAHGLPGDVEPVGRALASCASTTAPVTGSISSSAVLS
ncbi:hypothetical protein [Acidomonas methanolica]|uniref:hypothetical protein n=1 Tax=Acidomonas methanolica TaxID=437 RepID=UPI00351D0383